MEVPIKKSAIDYWLTIPKFYREFGLPQQPMLNFVERLARSGYAHRFYPSTSHSALGLARVATYEERCENRMVFIQYDHSNLRFTIKYFESDDGVSKKVVYAKTRAMLIMPMTLRCILIWLYEPPLLQRLLILICGISALRLVEGSKT